MWTEIKKQELTDGSFVYNVELCQKRETILFRCNSLNDAYKLAEILRTGATSFKTTPRSEIKNG